jgi:hypothetical protein
VITRADAATHSGTDRRRLAEKFPGEKEDADPQRSAEAEAQHQAAGGAQPLARGFGHIEGVVVQPVQGQNSGGRTRFRFGKPVRSLFGGVLVRLGSHYNLDVCFPETVRWIFGMTAS